MQGILSLRGHNERSKFFIKYMIYGVIVPFIVYLILAKIVSPQSAKLITVFVQVGLVALPTIGRLHDLGRPSTHYLLLLIPLYNWYFLACLFLKPGRIEKARLGKGWSGLRTVEEPQAAWNCPKCQTANPNTSYKCSHCHYSLV